MGDTRDGDAVIRRLVRWADERLAVRAMLLTSTRAIPHAPVDALSDYDIILVVRDLQLLAANRGWIADFGTVLVDYWSPIQADPDTGVARTGNVVQYADGLKIDFTLWPVALLDHLAHAPALPAELDAGYRVLLDKDGLAARLPSPTYRAYVPSRPTEQAYQALVREFFNDAPYAAKYLWRGELLPAKWCLDYDLKHVYLRRMLEWRMECDHDWSVPARNLGKGLERRLPADLRSRLAGTYAGGGIAENWVALFRTLALFHDVALTVAAVLGYTYPLDLDELVTTYLHAIHKREGGAVSGG